MVEFTLEEKTELERVDDLLETKKKKISSLYPILISLKHPT